jgi:hypothetical protein
MPAFAVAAIEYVGADLMMSGAAEAFGAFLLSNAGIIATGATILGGMALSYEQQKAAQRKAKDAYNAAQTDRMANVVTTIGQRELVLGRVRKAGTVFGRASTGANHTNLYIAIALAANEIDGIDAIYFNDAPVTIDGSGNVTSAPYALTRRTAKTLSFTGNTFTIPDATWDTSSVNVTRNTGSGVDGSGSSPVAITGVSGAVYTIGDSGGGDVTYQATSADAKARVFMYFGGAGQAVSAPLNSAFGTNWPTTSTATGVAYLVVEFTYDETAFPSGMPSVSAVIRGAKVYDPRTGTTAFSENPALLMRHVLTHPQFGKRTSISAAEDARIIAAANACDTSVTYTVGGVGTTRALYTAGTVLPFGNPAKACLDDLAQAMAGMWAYAGGQFYCKAGVYTAPVLALTDADLAVVKTDNSGQKTQQAITIGTHQARASKVNVITPRIWDSAQDYKEVALSPLVASTLVTRDGCWLAQEVTMPAITYSAQALHVAGITIRDARDPLTVTLPFKMTAYPLELFDSVTLTIPRYGWSAKEFMVLGRQWTLDGLIMLTLKETASAIFQMDASFSAQGYATNTNLPTPWTVSPPSNIVVASGPSNLQLNQDGTVTVRVKVSWDAITDSSILNGGTVEVQYRLASETLWHSVTVPGTSTFVYLIGAIAGDVGFVQVRTRNRVAVSDWSTMIGHTVTGKSAGPGLVTGLTATGIEHGIRISGTLPTDVDLAYIEVWTNTVNSLTGPPAAILQTRGLQATWDWIGLTSAMGTQYIWVRAVNTSGIAGSYTSSVNAIAGINATPGTVTGLTATGIIGGIRITGTLPADADLAAVQLFENTVNNSATATLLTQGLSDHYDRLGLLPSNGARYYWAKCVNTSGAVGAFSTVATATASQAVAAQIASANWSVIANDNGLKPANNADVTTTILGASGTSIVMNNANLFKSGGGVGGVFIGSAGLFGKNSSGVTTFSIDGATGAATFAGDITGGANINISGTGRFNGSYTASIGIGAVVANDLYGAPNGVVGYSNVSNGAGVFGYNSNGANLSTAYGVYGQTLSNAAAGVYGYCPTAGGTGVLGVGGTSASASSLGGSFNSGYNGVLGAGANGGYGVKGSAIGGGPAVWCFGSFQWGLTTYAAPGGTAVQYMRDDGTWTDPLGGKTIGNASGNIPVSNGTVNTNLNADKLDGFDATHFTVDGTGVGTTINGFSSGTGTGSFVSTTKPGTSTNNAWLTINIGGTLYDFPVWPR